MDKDKKRIFIQKIQNLPTLPSTLTKIIEIAEDPSSTAAELGEVISKDQSISSMILKLVNSAFYGHLRQISSIPHAIVILGFQTVKTMALGVSIFQPLPGGVRSGFDRNRFWIHSIGVATCAKKLAISLNSCSGLDKESVFLSGLLHDIGKVVFDNFFTTEYRDVVQAVKENGEWIRDVEERVIGLDHTEAGYYLANKWQFPDAVIDAIRFHHDFSGGAGDNSPDNKIEALVHTADHVCRKMRLGYGGDEQEVALSQVAAARIGLDEKALAECMEEMENERETIESFAFNKK